MTLIKSPPVVCGEVPGSVKKIMSRLHSAPPITALVYEDGAAASALLVRIAAELAATGTTCCGFVQRDEERPDRPRCDMFLVDVAFGTRLKISEDRGPHAKGCRLDASELARATALAHEMLAGTADILILNKYGKSESEGGGFRSLIAQALEQGVPVLIGVPRRNIAGWRAFAGDLAAEQDVEVLLRLDSPELLARLCMMPSAVA